MSKAGYRVLGLMSGTSLDGLDIADFSFIPLREGWKFTINRAETFKYDDIWTGRLSSAQELDAYGISLLNVQYGKYTGKKVLEFLDGKTEGIDLIASHGHTIFHQPEAGLTLQIGDPNSIFAKSGIKTISDFRALDVALGGQGAPLVPVGDRMLFTDYDYCLNLGGFSNISYRSGGKTYAFDPSPANMALNHIMNKQGRPFDMNGHLGRTGSLNKELLDKLNALDYYRLKAPKSLGREWFETRFIPVLENSSIPETDKLRTVYEHIAIQIAITVETMKKGKMLTTGGGAHNSFLIERLQAHSKHKIVVPANDIIDYKEALIFAFLGVLRIRGEDNCIASVTGASKNIPGD